jgi:hypothetical protein
MKSFLLSSFPSIQPWEGGNFHHPMAAYNDLLFNDSENEDYEAGLEKTRFFFFKNPAQLVFFFFFFGFFWAFWVFLVVFYIPYLPRRESF